MNLAALHGGFPEIKTGGRLADRLETIAKTAGQVAAPMGDHVGPTTSCRWSSGEGCRRGERVVLRRAPGQGNHQRHLDVDSFPGHREDRNQESAPDTPQGPVSAQAAAPTECSGRRDPRHKGSEVWRDPTEPRPLPDLHPCSARRRHRLEIAKKLMRNRRPQRRRRLLPDADRACAALHGLP